MVSTSRDMTSAGTDIGAMLPAIPTTASVLNMLEPRMLPSAISCSPLRVAMMEAASSGSDVPTAMTVRPITRSLTPRAWAISTAPQTSMRELAMSSTRPTTSQVMALPRGMARSCNSRSISSPRWSALWCSPR